MNALKKNKLANEVFENISTQEIRAHLAEMFKSRDFVASQRLMDFLAYVVEQTLEGQAKNIKAYSIAVDVFGLNTDFDPLINPLVRTEAARLRSKLEHYYLLNSTANIRISIPKGGYAPVFTRVQENADISQSWDLPELHTSIVVLPFENISDDAAGRNFNTGLRNEIITSLTRFRDLTVIDHIRYGSIAATTSEKQTSPPQARFVLGGGVLAQKKKFKLWVSLGDSKTNGSVWAESFSGVLKGDIFETLEIIAEKIVYLIAADFGLIQQTLLKEFDREQALSSPAQKAYLLYHRWVSRLSVNDFKLALAALEEVLATEPDNVSAKGMLADLYATNYMLSYKIVKDDLEKSLQMAINATNADPGCQAAHLALATNYFQKTKPSF
jgi:TolB-like protein